MPASPTTLAAITAALIAITVARHWHLCRVELAHRAAGRSGFTSELAVKNEFRTRAISETILIVFCGAAVAVTTTHGPAAGALVVAGYAVAHSLPAITQWGRRQIGRQGLQRTGSKAGRRSAGCM